MIIKNGLVWEESGSFRKKELVVDTTTHRIAETAEDDTVFDAEGLYVIPGLVDVHIHGARGHDFSDGNSKGLAEIAQYLHSCGVTSFCPTSMTLPEEQQLFFEKIAKRTRNIVTVVITGRPLDLRRISEKSRAVIMAWRPGTMGAEAVVDIVYGRTNPSGKLAVSIPWCVGQVPVSYWDIKTGHIYDADHPENRFSSRYMDIPNTPLYPFGFGLSYTEFNISDIEVQAGPDKRVHVHCKVSNTGKVAGAEVVQCYYETLCSSVVRPRKELVRFQRVFLEPGEKKTVDFSIDREEFSYYDENMEIVCSQMKLRISIGNSSDHEWGNSVIFV